MCKRWRQPVTGFQAFIAHIGPKPEAGLELDRIDNDKGYEPGNVRWASRKQQCANQRRGIHRKKPNRWKQISPETALAIFHAEGTHLQIATGFAVSVGVVSNIKNGATWSRVTERR